jgi:hypothetical protein
VTPGTRAQINHVGPGLDNDRGVQRWATARAKRGRASIRCNAYWTAHADLDGEYVPSLPTLPRMTAPLP